MQQRRQPDRLHLAVPWTPQSVYSQKHSSGDYGTPMVNTPSECSFDSTLLSNSPQSPFAPSISYCSTISSTQESASHYLFDPQFSPALEPLDTTLDHRVMDECLPPRSPSIAQGYHPSYYGISPTDVSPIYPSQIPSHLGGIKLEEEDYAKGNLPMFPQSPKQEEYNHQAHDYKQYPSFHHDTGMTDLDADAEDEKLPSADQQPENFEQYYAGSKEDGFYCRITDCKNRKELRDGKSRRTFKRRTDMIRHLRTVHFPKYFDCQMRRCERVGSNGFTRYDHYLEHLREYHNQNIPRNPKGCRRG